MIFWALNTHERLQFSAVICNCQIKMRESRGENTLDFYFLHFFQSWLVGLFGKEFFPILACWSIRNFFFPVVDRWLFGFNSIMLYFWKEKKDSIACGIEQCLSIFFKPTAKCSSRRKKVSYTWSMCLDFKTSELSLF